MKNEKKQLETQPLWPQRIRRPYYYLVITSLSNSTEYNNNENKFMTNSNFKLTENANLRQNI